MKLNCIYIKRIFSKIDVAPFGRGSIPKILIFIIWGINALVFLGEDIITGHDEYSCSLNGCCCILCTTTKKVSSTDLYVQNIEFINTSYFIVISSYNYEIPSFDVITVVRDRSPPFNVLIFS